MNTKLDGKKFAEWMTVAFWATSFAMLSFYLLLKYEKWLIIFTVLPTFAAAFFFVSKSWKENYQYAKRHPLILAAAVFISVDMVIKMHQIKGAPNIAMYFHPLPFHFFRFRWWLLAVPALCYLFIWVCRKGRGFLAEFWDGMGQTQRKTYVLLTVISSVLIFILYAENPQWYLQYDQVYSIDSGWAYQSILQNPFYYDIRHPFLNVFAFPLWATVHFVLRIFVPGQLLDTMCASCIQIINVQFLLLTGFMIEKLSKSRAALFLYLASSPMIIFSVFLEKYQFCVFLLMLYIYRRCTEKKNPEADLILACGSMATGFFLAATELLFKESWKIKAQRLFRIAAQGVALLICTGRIHLLNPGTLWAEVSAMAHAFGFKSFSAWECFISFAKAMQGSFWGLSSAAMEQSQYVWTNLLSGISVLNVLLIAIIVAGLVICRTDSFLKICGAWVVFAVILFMGFQWSVHESPLFSLYFSWAFIPLFQKGLQFVTEKLAWNEKIVYGIVLSSMIAVNILNIIDIKLFFNR